MGVKKIVDDISKLLNIEVDEDSYVSGIIPFAYVDITTDEPIFPKIEADIFIIIQDINEVDYWILYKAGKNQGRIDYFYLTDYGNLLETKKIKLNKNTYQKVIDHAKLLTENEMIFNQLKERILNEYWKNFIKNRS